jgi:hypothetical protein
VIRREPEDGLADLFLVQADDLGVMCHRAPLMCFW